MHKIKFPLLITALSVLSGCDSQQAAVSQTPSQEQIKPQDASSHWLTQNHLAIQKQEAAVAFELVTTQNRYSLTPVSSISLPLHLSQFYTLTASVPVPEIKQALKGEIVLNQIDKAGKVIHSSIVQTGKVIDDIYTSSNNDADEVTDLGAIVTAGQSQFKLWAPTATNIEVLLFDKNKQPLSIQSIQLNEDTNTGVWSASLKEDLTGSFYQYKISVYHPESRKKETIVTTDPYSLNLSTNSKYSHLISLDSDNTKPKGWDNQIVPTLEAVEDSMFYETHIRDFSAGDNSVSQTDYKGKYKAFSETSSDGIKHLKALRSAGISHIHLLPTFDLGTINEDPAQRVNANDTIAEICQQFTDLNLCKQELNPSHTLQQVLLSKDTTTGDSQNIIEEIRDRDDYNWGYDPFHYTVPEGSYAVNPDGETRIVEFREMIQSIHNMGFRVVMDVVYNHTHQAGLKSTSVLDKIVPNYYQRLNPITGQIEQSTCCDNTASEHKMMAKLMVDSLKVWARDYKIDGFRFDLMAHQPKQLMLEAREAIREIDPDTYFYGEGWNFGEVANNAQFVQASQLEMAGTEIGTFTDRLRDAVRGGGDFDSGDKVRTTQGLGNGLVTFDNDVQPAGGNLDKYNLSMDQLRVGLAGNLANYPLINHKGENVTGKDIPYGDQPTGYALDPADTINYVSKHDNQTLWDNNQYRLPYHATTDQRVRLQMLSLAYPILAQGIPFLHMGAEFLRSKSFLRDSYDYATWFNNVDFSKQSNNYNVGLPAAVKDQANWTLIKRVLKNNQGRDLVSPDHIALASEMYLDLVRIRTSSRLFRLQTEQQIIERLKFHNTGAKQQQGIIVMSLNDSADNNINKNKLDSNWEQIVVVFNANTDAKTVQLPTNKDYTLHPAQLNGADEQVKTTKLANGKAVIPALTVAVLVK